MKNKVTQGQGYKFEEFTRNLFLELGFKTVNNRNLKIHNSKSVTIVPDIFLEKDDKQYCIEVKFSKINGKDIDKIFNFVKKTDVIPVIVTPFIINDRFRNLNKKKYPNLEIIDISNLLYFVQYNEKIKSELMSLLPYTVENIEPRKPFIDDCIPSDKSESDILIDKLNNCKPGSGNFRKYEEICYNILKLLFADDLTLWKKQLGSNKELYKFDLLCRTKDDNIKTFWSIVENYFKSKYIVFEFKNYTDQVSQKEIYTTEKYLYAKALRSVAIIITPNGYDKNAKWAAKGSLRENGKLILLLTNKDLLNMLKMREDLESPSDYLLEKLDALLCELEK